MSNFIRVILNSYGDKFIWAVYDTIDFTGITESLNHKTKPSNPSAAGGHPCARLVRRGILRSRARGVSRDSPAAFERRHRGLLRGFLPWKIPLTRFSRVTSKRVIHFVASSHRREYTFVCIRRYKLMHSFYLTARKTGTLKRQAPFFLALHHPEPVFGRNSTPPLRGSRLEQSILYGIRLRRMV